MMGHESKSFVSCVWRPGRVRVLAHGIPGRLCAVFPPGQARATDLSAVPQPGSEPQGTTFPRTANGVHRTQAGISGDRGAQVPVPGLRPHFRGVPPFAPAYARYTHRLQAFIEDLRGMMTVSDLAALTGLGWDTIKNIIKAKLEKDFGRPRLKELQNLSIDEIYLGRQKRFYTLVIDLDTGRIVWAAPGRGGDTLRKFWRALRLSKAKIKAVAMDMSPAYWAAVRENLPEAAVVFDRFHLVKLVNEKLDDLRRDLVREAEGLMKKTVKGLRWLLLMRRENVAAEKLPQLEEALKHNEPLSIGYAEAAANFRQQILNWLGGQNLATYTFDSEQIV
jgi:hypothetical protein